jgi:hypothetical protein
VLYLNFIIVLCEVKILFLFCVLIASMLVTTRVRSLLAEGAATVATQRPGTRAYASSEESEESEESERRWNAV